MTYLGSFGDGRGWYVVHGGEDGRRHSFIPHHDNGSMVKSVGH